MRSSSADQPARQVWVPDVLMKRGVKFLLEHACGGLLADPGAAKTSIALQAFKILLAEGMVERLVVIAPKRPCYLVWPAELEKWEQFKELRCAVLHGPKREQELARGLKERAQVFIVSNHHENLQWFFSDGRWRKLLGGAVLAIDESSKFKRMRTQRFQAIRQYLPRFRRRWLFTGSPAPEGLLDLHGQVFLLDLGKTFTPHVSYFKKAFFDDTGYGGFDCAPKSDKHEKEIFKRLAPYVLRLEDKGVGKPQLRVNPVYVELPTKARKAYDKLEDEFWALIDDKEVTAFNAGALSTKLQQAASGGIYEDREVDEKTGQPKRERGPRKWLKLHDEKTEALDEVLGELQGQQLLIMHHFGHDLERVKGLLGKDLAVLGGGSIKRDAELQRAWLARELQYMAGHPASIGHGLNLQTGGAHHIFCYTLVYDQELYDQFIRRLWRRGNPAAHVTVHRCLARGTVDEAKVLALDTKTRNQHALFNALLAYRRARGR